MIGPIESIPTNEFIPFWAWNRLESRPRKKEFKDSLRAEIYDGLWMIGRQWQLGEFKGNDTGSGILARTSMDYFTITGIGPADMPVVPYNQEKPIEAAVEPVMPVWSLKEKFLLGNKWIALMNNLISTIGNFTTYKGFFTGDSSLSIKENSITATSSDNDIFNSFKAASKPGLNAFLNSCNRKGIRLDGAALYRLLLSPNWNTLLANAISSPVIDSIIVSNELSTVRNAFLLWVSKQYSLADAGIFWDKESLEYRFKTEWETAPGQSAVLKSNYYQEKSIDWYSLSQVNIISSQTQPNNKTRQIIMTQSRFPGMPSSRWWEMEDGSVNFCDINSETTDIAKILATQFALVYQDDWFVIPYKVPVGSYSSVKGIMVTDVFGITTFIPNYKVEGYESSSGFQMSTEDWKDWRWMEISGQQVSNPNTQIIRDSASGSLVILPVIHRQQQSDPLEEVVFARDEMADLVWAIEKVVPDEMGKGMDGFRLSNVFLEKLRQFRPSAGTNTTPTVTAPLDYKLQDSNVPENCIPFIPVHVPGSNRSIRFQRAAMPRLLENYEPSLVRPATSILKPINGAYTPYFINEEEISRAGVILQTRNQRTRWYNGKIINWTNYQRSTGRGTTSLGLEYDTLKPRD